MRKADPADEKHQSKLIQHERTRVFPMFSHTLAQASLADSYRTVDFASTRNGTSSPSSVLTWFTEVPCSLREDRASEGRRSDKSVCTYAKLNLAIRSYPGHSHEPSHQMVMAL